ncbi:hypothetical protein JQM69_01845 [Faecalicatena contorta]|uniref:LptM family lipoprotein n=1 Tax=Faecalicatena contorta TaxID=39482 RepID=UPI001F1A186C|nr:hypothetical protein [Faecalicatena contorta]MCF2679460.1 hypothetical protein [Faecalicatena contorta]
MKKIRLILMTLLVFALLAGCGSKNTAEKYVGSQITDIKEGNVDLLSSVLDAGIEESDSLYTLSFPEELKETYLSFLKEAFKSIEFEVSSAKENGENTYSVRVSFSPLDIGTTTEDVCNDYVNNMTSSDLTAEVSTLLENAQKAIADKPVYGEETYITLTVKKDGDAFSIADEDMHTFLMQVFLKYMQPYDSVCEILNEQDYLTAYLDATFKGEVAQFARHTNQTEDEVYAWYEEDVFTPPAELSAAYADRYETALKEIFRQCKYTVGIPKKESGGYNYTVDVTVIPNRSLANATAELANNTYYSVDALSKGFVEILEKYAASPVYGEETVVTISVDYQTLSSAGEADAEMTRLGDTIIPGE